MPFVLGPEAFWPRPTKRRRVYTSSPMARTISEEASPPEVDDGPLPYRPAITEPPKPKVAARSEVRTSDRDELIQCIKRGERPTWVPKPNLEALCAEVNSQVEAINTNRPLVPIRKTSATAEQSALITPNTPSPHQDPIPRPPSALHAGDFYEPSAAAPTSGRLHSRQSAQLESTSFDPSNASPPPWMSDAPPPRFLRMPSDSITLASSRISAQRSRAPSLGSSLSSSFVMRTPTSPLVHATSSPTMDLVEDRRPVDPTVEDREQRRRTLPPQSFSSVNLPHSNLSSSNPAPSQTTGPIGSHRGHQSRRSLTSFTYQPASTAQGVYPSRNRRLSYASESSSRSRNSMVGSFEESILRGRMSTPPSKPLDFVAQIGVLGKGDCPDKLKCPPHVSVPFPAVFYNYPSASVSRTVSDDSPSPYVGTIDLEEHLKAVEEPVRRRRKAESNDPETAMAELTAPHNTTIGRALARKVASEDTAATTSPKILLDGAYRVPQQGQLQLIIKNPNKTAVKLFLIPYDLAGMTAGMKTFVRQRSYSSGPIMENVLSDKPIQDPLSNKRILRYLIHLKFCCISKGRFYLYDNIRVVFANRVPEGKEKLSNEIQLPEPKYSPFIPGSRSRRQSQANSPTSSQSFLPVAQCVADNFISPYSEEATDAFFVSKPIPFQLGHQATIQDQRMPNFKDSHAETDYGQQDDNGEDIKNTLRPQSPEVHGFGRVSTSQRGSPVPWHTTNIELARGRSPSPALVVGDGLLSKRLREFQNTRQHAWPKDGDKPRSGKG